MRKFLIANFFRLLACSYLFMAMAVAAAPGLAEQVEPAPATTMELTELSLEELMNIEVTLVSRKAERLSEAAAAVYVITQEDIRRSGLTSIPEILRMVPGLQVAKIDVNKWAVTSRGFNGLYANKLLVLMDGRSIYTPAFSGVFWDIHDTLIEDIERIEIIRGPGATMWGANAVNGIINIITKKAGDTQGGSVTTEMGSHEIGSVGVRYGAMSGPDTYYRVYVKPYKKDALVGPAVANVATEYDMLRGGFRLDWDGASNDSLTVQGDVYRDDVTEASYMPALTPPFASTVDDNSEERGYNVLARWRRRYSETSGMALQVYCDLYKKTRYSLSDVTKTFDIDFQHNFTLGERHNIIWGLGYRRNFTDLNGSFLMSFEPPSYTDDLISAFVQDKISLAKDRLSLTLGSKFEWNDYTGLEIQPSVSLAWTLQDHQTVWAAVSRAVKTPDRVQRSLHVNAAAFPAQDGTINLVSILGNPDFESEELLAYELGYRRQMEDHFSFDIATFYNFYDNLESREPGAPFLELDPAPPHLVIPTYFDNKMKGRSYGVEIAVNWDVTDRWKLRAGYSGLQLDISPKASSADVYSEQMYEGASSQSQFHIRSQLDFSNNLEFDNALYYVDGIVVSEPGVATVEVPGYIRFDARLGWRPTEKFDMSVGIRNAFDDRHREFGTQKSVEATDVERTIYGKVTWRF